MEHLNDKKFVRKLKAGDPNAFRDLYLALAPKIVSFLVRIWGMSVPDAEEVADDALLKVHRGVANFDPSRGAKLTTWVFEVAKNAGIDHYRKVKRRGGDEDETPADEPGEYVGGPRKKAPEPVTEPVAFGRGTGDAPALGDIAALRAFKTLSEKEKDILRVRDVMSYEEIAKVEGTTVNAVSTRYSRALQKLKAAYAKEKSDER